MLSKGKKIVARKPPKSLFKDNKLFAVHGGMLITETLIDSDLLDFTEIHYLARDYEPSDKDHYLQSVIKGARNHLKFADKALEPIKLLQNTVMDSTFGEMCVLLRDKGLIVVKKEYIQHFLYFHKGCGFYINPKSPFVVTVRDANNKLIGIVCTMRNIRNDAEYLALAAEKG